jgi:hypothetical protein
MFGIVNEYKSLPCTSLLSVQAQEWLMVALKAWNLDIIAWGDTVQYVTNAIRQDAGITDQYVLVPGTHWQGLMNWVDESRPDLYNVTDPNRKMFFDVHKVCLHAQNSFNTCSMPRFR